MGSERYSEGTSIVWSRTKSRTSGSAIASPWAIGTTSGFPKASPRISRSCSWSTTAGATHSSKDSSRAGRSCSPSRRRNPQLAVIHDNLSDTRKILNGLVYQKGGWTLHMLRKLVGTESFWKGIRHYFQRHRDDNVTTDDFRPGYGRSLRHEFDLVYSAMAQAAWLARRSRGIGSIIPTRSGLISTSSKRKPASLIASRSRSESRLKGRQSLESTRSK